MTNIRTEFAWQAVDEKLGEQIIAFWKHHGALPRAATASARLSEVAMVAFNDENALAAISSVQARHVAALGHRFYAFRCFVAPDFRRALLAARLVCEVYDAFNARFVAGASPDVIGMIAEAENPALNRDHNQAVWPHSKFVFCGYNAAGQQVRVRYFDGARIASRI